MASTGVLVFLAVSIDFVHRFRLILCTSDAPRRIGGDERVRFVAVGRGSLRVSQHAVSQACSRLMNTMPSIDLLN